MIKKLIPLSLFNVLLTSCITDNQTNTLSPEIVFRLHRFEKEFYNPLIPLDSIQKKYPFFFPKTTDDSIWKAKRTDSLEIAIFSSIDSLFKNNDYLLNMIAPLIRKAKKINSKIQIKDVYTMNSDFDFEYRIVAQDTMIIIGLDNYLGSKYNVYKGIPKYLTKRFDKKYLSIDLAESLAKLTVPPLKGNETFVEKLVYYGKIEWMKQLLNDDKEEHNLLRYSKEELNWCEENEFNVWNYFVQNDLLFSKSSALDYRFFKPSPFSKFYLELDNDTPGEIGKWIGLRIVQKYVKVHSSMPAQEIINQPDLMTFFHHSKYKPSIN